MAIYNITISNITGSTTPCDTYNIYTGFTSDFPNTVLFSGATIPNSGYTFQFEYIGSELGLYVFVEHCDGHLESVEDLSCCGEPTINQGGYQVKFIEFPLCVEITPTPTITPTITQTITPTITPTITQTITPTITLTPTLTITPTITAPCLDCPSGYTWTYISGDTCVAIDEVSATPPVAPYTAYTRTYFEYSISGTSVYEPGWNINGTGTEDVHLNTVDVWRNNTGTNGPLNRTGIWAYDEFYNNTDFPLLTWLGFNYCLTGITGGDYYIGIGADNEFRLEIDGNVILDTKANSGLDEVAKFRLWNVYPVTLPAGDHIIGLYGYNLSGATINPAGFGCEIYENTLAELTGATSVGDLNIIFTSADFVGYTFPVVKDQLGNYLSSGYTCPSGYEYAPCDGNCWKFIYCPPTPTPTPTITPTLTPTITPTITITATPPCLTGTTFLMTVPVWTGCTEICSGVAGLDYSVESSTPTLGLGTFLYQVETCMQTPVPASFYGCGDGNCYEVDSNGEIIGITSCNPEINISNISLNVPVTDVTISGTSVTHVSGTNFTINAGDPMGYFSTSVTGTQDIIVYYGSHISGQNIIITDSANNSHCCDLNGGSGTCVFTNAVVSASQAIQIVVSDGTCT